MLSSEFVIVDNPLPTGGSVTGIYLLNHNLFIYGDKNWVKFDMRGNKEDEYSVPLDKIDYPISCEYQRVLNFNIIQIKFEHIYSIKLIF